MTKDAKFDRQAAGSALLDAFLYFQSSCIRREGRSSPRKIDPDALKAAYGPHFQRVEFKCGSAKERPVYDGATYPSLFFDFPILKGGRGICSAGLPKKWTRRTAAAALRANPLATMLAAFIWKQSDFPDVSLVLQGILDKPLQDGKGAVLYQFGRHLVRPPEEPIFDRNVHRARCLLDLISRAEEPTTALAVLRDCRGNERIAGLFRETAPKGKELVEYRRWWNEHVEPLLARSAVKRAKAILWVDRWLYSLGKAAVLVL
jgi:hypothetical protein